MFMDTFAAKFALLRKKDDKIYIINSITHLSKNIQKKINSTTLPLKIGGIMYGQR